MGKQSVVFRCTKCDSQYPKWQGRCTECGSWGTITEIKQSVNAGAKRAASVVRMSDTSAKSHVRIQTGMSEVDRVLGDGLVSGGVYLMAGDPGIGKSTLLLQIAHRIQKNVLYVSGEESLDQVKARAARLGVALEQTGFLAETDVETIAATLESERPQLAIVDSLQTLHLSSLAQEPGSITQVKAAASALVEVAKNNGIAIIMVSHVTKSGTVAGPKTLEHLVDCVLYIEGDEHHQHRILRSTKNRFGSVSEIGVFTVTGKGFEEITNPAKVFLEQRSAPIAGSLVTPVVEGSRVFFVECQALLTRTRFGYPVRKSVGFDQNRLVMLLAVLQKRVGLPLDQYDVHINVAGGMKMQEPSCDLAVLLAIVSALKNIPVKQSIIAFGEVGLTGEVRSVPFAEKRISESKRLGFLDVYCPQVPNVKAEASLHTVTSVSDVFKQLFGG